MVAILLEEDLTFGLCLTPTKNPDWPVNTLCISVIVGMHRLKFGKHFWLMVFEGKSDMSQTYFYIHYSIELMFSQWIENKLTIYLLRAMASVSWSV